MPGRPFPHRLRHLIWLTCIPVASVVALSVVQLVALRLAADPFTWAPSAQCVADDHQAAQIDEDALLRLIRLFHPDPLAELKQTEAAKDVPSEPTLRAFAISMWIHGESGETTLTLRCKDPAHDVAYCIGTDEPDKNVRLVRVNVDNKLARFTVRRGDEQHTFLFDRSREFHSSVIRFHPPGSRQAGNSHRSQAVASSKHPDLKVVPFFDYRGNCIGMRVTGTRAHALRVHGQRPDEARVDAPGCRRRGCRRGRASS